MSFPNDYFLSLKTTSLLFPAQQHKYEKMN